MESLLFQIKFWLFYIQISLAYTWLFWPIVLLSLWLAFWLGVRIERRRFWNQVKHLLDRERRGEL